MLRLVALSAPAFLSIALYAEVPADDAVTHASRSECIPRDHCCRVCSAGVACGASCIAANKHCHKGRGCACNESEVCSGD